MIFNLQLFRHPCEGRGPAFLVTRFEVSWVPAFSGMTGKKFVIWEVKK
jgi:hypothetical protein